jgi:hypothetical protein
MGERTGDHEALRRALKIVSARVSGAMRVSFRTTDQDYVGFVLAGVGLPEDRNLEEENPAEFDALAEDVWPLISGIGWDGVMGEDRYGEATIEVSRWLRETGPER